MPSATITTPLTGRALLNCPSLNKGSAFSREERKTFNLEALLPLAVDDLELQCQRAYEQLQTEPDDLHKYTFLAQLHDQNEVLFFSLCGRHLEELLPIIYTPTAAKAIAQYSRIFHRPDGLFFTRDSAGTMRDAMLNEKKPGDVDLIIVSDAEAILGIGDQGVGGIIICIGKGYIYTLGGGIDPSRILPIILDVGTDNEDLVKDPLYLGDRSPRLRGKKYDDLIERLTRTVREDYPNVLLHFEDFGKSTAQRILDKYRPKQSIFDDDIQGTAAVVMAALRSACQVEKVELKDQKIVVYGFGSAGLGIADGIRNAMVHDGVAEDDAAKAFWAVDVDGLITSETKELRVGQDKYARVVKELEGWKKDEKKGYELLEVVKQVKPTILIGTSTQANAFTEEIVREMAKNCSHPIILPLSNPTSLAEATPEHIQQWTNGKGLVAAGSPFPPINVGGKKSEVAEANNALIYPGLGLGAIVSRASRLTDAMIVAGVNALASLSPALNDPHDALLPGLEDLRHVSAVVALAVANQARKEGVSEMERDSDFKLEDLQAAQWEPIYPDLMLAK